MKLSMQNMKKRAEALENVIEAKRTALEKAPPGRVRISSAKGILQAYYIAEGSEGTQGKYLRASEKTLLSALVQKDYDERVLKNAESELRTLKTLIAKYENGIIEDIYEKLSPQRQKLAEPVEIPDDIFVKSWLAEPFVPLGFDENEPEIYSSGGLRVRSKNECIAADKYDEWKVPYKFECPLHLKGFRTVYPDFTLLNVKKRKVIYHEILGKMTESGYSEENIAKIQAYMRNGIMPGRDLILTFDSRRHPMRPNDIELIIKNFLV